jgi:hypothetical protein
MADATVPQEAVTGLFELESARPLRDSLLWRLQTSYYASKGVECWEQGTVPNFVTSNAFLANAYAKVILGNIQDWYR